jgi:thiamine kinase-like enzyme
MKIVKIEIGNYIEKYIEIENEEDFEKLYSGYIQEGEVEMAKKVSEKTGKVEKKKPAEKTSKKKK